MFEIMEAVKKMIVKLNEIQPAVSVAGMTAELGKIMEIKVDMVLMLSNITPDHPCMQRVLAVMREDVIGSAVALFDYMGGIYADPEEMDDKQLQVALLAAEAFALRGRDYLDSKRKAAELAGGNYGRA